MSGNSERGQLKLFVWRVDDADCRCGLAVVEYNALQARDKVLNKISDGADGYCGFCLVELYEHMDVSGEEAAWRHHVIVNEPEELSLEEAHFL